MVRHVRANQMIEAIVVLSVKHSPAASTMACASSDTMHTLCRYRAVFVKRSEPEGGMEGRYACTGSAHPIRWRRSDHSWRLARLRVLSRSRTA
jgi:hypothetical protein